jgi:hypothetical protein
VKNRFQILPFKRNLQRYIMGAYECLLDATSPTVVDVFGRMQSRKDDVDSHFYNEVGLYKSNSVYP